MSPARGGGAGRGAVLGGAVQHRNLLNVPRAAGRGRARPAAPAAPTAPRPCGRPSGLGTGVGAGFSAPSRTWAAPMSPAGGPARRRGHPLPRGTRWPRVRGFHSRPSDRPAGLGRDGGTWKGHGETRHRVPPTTGSRADPRCGDRGETGSTGAPCTDPCTAPGVCPNPAAFLLLPAAGFVPGRAQPGQRWGSLPHAGLSVLGAAAVGPSESWALLRARVCESGLSA